MAIGCCHQSRLPHHGCAWDQCLTVLDVRTGTVRDTISAASVSTYIVVDARSGRVYVIVNARRAPQLRLWCPPQTQLRCASHR